MLRALAEHWDDVLGRLDGVGRAELVRLTGVATSVADPEARTDAVLDIVGLVLPVLPLGHPVEAAIGTTRSAPADAPPEPDLDPTLALLRAVIAPAGPAPETPLQGVRRRLLNTETLSVDDLLDVGSDPGAAHLIRLDDESGRARFPAFQFGPYGDARPVVVAVNTILEADEDPWGAADWWLCPNAWLRAVPADLVGRVDDSLLIETAELEVTHDA